MHLQSSVLPAACLLVFVFAPALIRAQEAPSTDTTPIIATIHEEKDAYVALDATRLAATWVHRPSSLKLYVFDGREERYDGFAAIETHDRANLDRERSVPPAQRTRFSFSDFRVIRQGDSAWVTCHATWTAYSAGTTISGKQTRVYVLQWVDGRWRIALMTLVGLAPEAPPPASDPSAVHLNAAN